MSARLVVVDDTDPNINYVGSSWFQDTGSQDSVGNFGPSYRSTLHGTKSSASLSYAFNGSQVRVWGSNNRRNDSGVLDPQWECFVDKISIGATTPFQFPENNWVFCEQTQLIDGPHILTVNATVAKQQTFWLDQINYVPSASVPLDGKAILVDNHDATLQFGDGWTSLGGTANMTTKSNSIFAFDFIGVSLAWYGFIPTELPHNATTARYSVDGEDPVSFLLNGLPPNSGTVYNQKFFETKQYSPGPHTIVVTYLGGSQTTPLTLDYIVVQNGTFPSPSTAATSSAQSPTVGSDKSNTANSKSNNIGAIAGGVVGGLVLIILALLAFLYLRRREKKLNKNHVNIDPEPFFQYAPVTQALPQGGGYRTQHTNDGYIETGATAGSSRHPQFPSMTSTELHSAVTLPTNSSGMHTSGAASVIQGNDPLVPVRNTPTVANAYLSSMSEKARREAVATAAALRPSQRNQVLPTPPGSDTSVSSAVIRHEDSGLRLPQQVTLEEIPPLYTAG